MYHVVIFKRVKDNTLGVANLILPRWNDVRAQYEASKRAGNVRRMDVFKLDGEGNPSSGTHTILRNRNA